MGKKSNKPHNTVHNWLDMLFRGFSPEAKKDFKESQESSRYYPPARDIEKYQRRLHKCMEINRPDTAANSKFSIVPGGETFPRLISKPPAPPLGEQGDIRPLELIRPSVARTAASENGSQIVFPPSAKQAPQQPRTIQKSNQGPQSNPSLYRQSQREDEKAETKIGLAQLENISPQRPAQRESQRSSRQAMEASAMPTNEASHASTARMPTERAELFDNGRTFVEGMAYPRGYPRSRFPRRPSRR
jgi:hypothetical protein